MIIKNMINIKYNELTTAQREKLDRFLKRKCKKKNPLYFKTLNMGFPVYNIKPLIYLYDQDRQGVYLFRGLLDDVLKVFPELDIKDNRRDFKCSDFKNNIVLRNYQEREVNKILDTKAEQGYIHAVCRSGKTYMSIDLVHKLKQRTLILVHTKYLLEQWKSDILSNTDIKFVGEFHGNKKKLGNQITIGLIQSVVKHIDELKDMFGMVILDECHHVPARTFLEVINGFNSRYRFGLTATLKRKDGLEFLIPPTFGNECASVTKEDVHSINKAPDIKIIIVPTQFQYNAETKMIKKDKNRLKYLLKQAIQKGNERQISLLENKLRDYNFNYIDYIDQIVCDDDRNRLILKLIKKEIKGGTRCLVYCDRIKHCKILNFFLRKAGHRTISIIGETKNRLSLDGVYEFVANKMEENKLKCAIGTPGCINESMTIPSLGAGFITCSATLSNFGKLEQQIGRLECYHPDVPEVRVYIFWDQFVENFYNPYNKLCKKFGSKNVSIYKEEKEGKDGKSRQNEAERPLRRRKESSK